MKKFFAMIAMLGLMVSAAQASSLRLYLSETGTDDGTIGGAAGSPGQAEDPTVDGSGRLWVWATPIGAGTTVNGMDFNIIASGDAQIDGYNFWNHSLQVANRWEAGGFPGESAAAGNDTGNLVFVAVTTPGVTNGPFAGFDTQHDAGTGSTVIGYVDVSGTNGAIDIRFNEGSIAAPNSYDSTFLGLDDVDGNAGPGAYSNNSPEATVVPEPASLLLLGLAGLALRRR